jgi:hypothetical protein
MAKRPSFDTSFRFGANVKPKKSPKKRPARKKSKGNSFGS